MFKWWTCRVVWTPYSTALPKHTCLHTGPSVASLSGLFLGLCYRPRSTTLFPTPPHALLDGIEHMCYSCALVIPLLPHPCPISLSPPIWLPTKLKDDRMEDDVGMVCLSSMPSTSDGRWRRIQDVTCCSLGGGSVYKEYIGRWRQQMSCMQACVFRPVWRDTESKWH
jgi:hypothetical protein